MSQPLARLPSASTLDSGLNLKSTLTAFYFLLGPFLPPMHGVAR